MKAVFFFMFLFFIQTSYTQPPLGIVFNPRAEFGLVNDIDIPTENPLFFYGIGTEKIKNNVQFTFNLLHLETSVTTSKRDVKQGSHGTVLMASNYKGTAKLRYFSLQASYGYISDKRIAQFFIGLQFQNDFLYSYKQYDLSHHKVVQTSNGYVETSTTHTDYQVLDSHAKNIFSGGLRTGLRINFREICFVDMSVQCGFQSSSRFNKEISSQYIEAAIKFFYRF